jgi:signal transduction histidine kinase
VDLRSIITWITVAVVVVSVCVAGALAVSTTTMRETTSAAAAATESVRLAEAAQVSLLMHQRATDPIVRRDIEGALRQDLSDARRQLTTAHEAEVLGAAEARVNDFLAASAAASPAVVARREAAFSALEDLVAVNTAQAEDATRQAEALDRLGDIVGYGVAAGVVVGAIAFLFWFRRRAFAPVFEIATQMESFSRGEGAAPVREVGAAELRTLAHGFNEMTSTIARQRTQQLTFLAGVAHDLRNPLTALRLSSDAVAPGRPLPGEDRIRQSFARVQRQVDRLERMVSDFLDAARIEAGNLELQLEDCDLREVLRAAVELFAPTAPSHRFVTDVPAEPVCVSCDPDRIEQVLNNLVSNAIKYSPRGGAVRVSISRAGDAVQLSVTDAGIGITPEDLEHVFEPFRRAHASGEGIAGVGLGLFTAKRIVQAHGGRLTATSVPGSGSTFTLELPVSERAQREAPLIDRAERRPAL